MIFGQMFFKNNRIINDTKKLKFSLRYNNNNKIIIIKERY